MMVLVNIGRYWLVFGGTGSVWGSTGWYLMILGQFNLVLIGIELYWVNKGLLCLYILKKINGDANQPTDQLTNRANIGQSVGRWLLPSPQRCESNMRSVAD